MMKLEPDEERVHRLMEKLDLPYDSDPINRIGSVLEKMETFKFRESNKRVDHDL